MVFFPSAASFKALRSVLTANVVDGQAEVLAERQDGLVRPVTAAVRLVVLGDDLADVVARVGAKDVAEAPVEEEITL